ncbi:MAG: response regulator [Gammaproteobacteria bacterium]|nr:response regulator [Gammaproteobacteria bacterium]
MATNILIVDDERAILFAMREYFAAFGYDVDCARDKQEAKALLDHRTYAVLISDLRLSGAGDTDGLDIAAYARARNPAMRSILLTAYGTPEIERSAHALGIDVCLSKPRPLDEIVETVAELMNEKT